MKKLLVLLFSILISFNSYGDKVLYCTDDIVSGIGFVNGEWKSEGYKSSRVSIRFNDDYSQVSGLKLLESDGYWDCKDTYSNPSLKTIVCFSPYDNGGIFLYHKDKKRYLYSLNLADAYVDDNRKYNDYIKAGTCEDF